MINLENKEIFKKVGYELSGDIGDLSTLDRLISNYKLMADVLSSKQKKSMEFIKRSYITKNIIKSAIDSWKKDEDEWMVLRNILLEKNFFKMDYYDIYRRDKKSSQEYLTKVLSKFGSVRVQKIFDADFLSNLKIQRVVITLNVSQIHK